VMIGNEEQRREYGLVSSGHSSFNSMRVVYAGPVPEEELATVEDLADITDYGGVEFDWLTLEGATQYVVYIDLYSFGEAVYLIELDGRFYPYYLGETWTA